MTDQPAPFDYGALAAALAKAQSSFPVITRSRTVKVTSKSGASYTFKYAPLDTIFDAVRKPLAENGLAITQLIDGTDLVTMLLHSGGATISGRAPLPNHGTVQDLGSAITYLRRYALQAILGIASEEDDDGNHASGNRATVINHGGLPEPVDGDGLIGMAEVSKTDLRVDFLMRQTPEGPILAFRLTDGKKGWKVYARGVLAELITEYREGIENQRVTCWGTFSDEDFTKTEAGKKKTIVFQVLNLSRLKVGTLDLTEPDAEPDEEPESDGPYA